MKKFGDDTKVWQNSDNSLLQMDLQSLDVRSESFYSLHTPRVLEHLERVQQCSFVITLKFTPRAYVVRGGNGGPAHPHTGNK